MRAAGSAAPEPGRLDAGRDCKLEASDWASHFDRQSSSQLRLVLRHSPRSRVNGSGLVGTHWRRIWHGRYRRACDRRHYGRLCLRMSKGSSGRGGRASKPPARAERRAAHAARPDESLVRSIPEERGGAEHYRAGHNHYDAPAGCPPERVGARILGIGTCRRWWL
jgi:hypothetical protein